MDPSALASPSPAAIVATHAVVFFLLGSCVGSFLNVVAFRLPRGLSLLRPPSFCPACDRPIAASDNLPIIGWLLLRGRARCCGAPISARYPLGEALTGLAWAVTAALHALPARGPAIDAAELTLWLTVAAMLIAASFIDYDHRYLPDAITLGGCVLAVAASAALPFLHPWAVARFPAVNPHLVAGLYSLTALFATWGALLVLTAIGNLACRRALEKAQREDPEADTVLGLGDVKLMAFFGALFGLTGAAVIFFLGAVYGAVFGSALKLRSGVVPPPPPGAPAPSFWARLAARWESGDSVMPLGPCLCAAALTWLWAKPQLSALAARWLAFCFGAA